MTSPWLPDTHAPIGKASMGFPYGHYGIYNQLIRQAVICSKILSANENRIFLFDAMVHDGSRGGLLINVYDGRIIGVVGGRFEPQEVMPTHLKRTEAPIKTNVSYAVSVDHAAALMEEEGAFEAHLPGLSSPPGIENTGSPPWGVRSIQINVSP